ncbi:MAG: type II toxin-antitoxin system RelE/ParE family toxin [Polyangiales bacterium]
MTVRLLPEAIDDIDAAYAWLFERAPSAAERMRRDIGRALALLDGLELGRVATLTDGREVRRWPIGTMVIYYRRRGDVLEVLRVFDARRAPIEG